MLHYPRGGYECWHVVRPMLQHHVDCSVIQNRSVLHTVGTGCDSILDGLRPVRVSHAAFALLVCFFDRRLHLLDGELGSARIWSI